MNSVDQKLPLFTALIQPTMAVNDEAIVENARFTIRMLLRFRPK